MYYEDENNLYHYSYRRGDKREVIHDVDFSDVPNHDSAADPWDVPKKKQKTHRGLRLAAFAIVCALGGGLVGAGVMRSMGTGSFGSTEIEVSDRQVAEVRQVKVDGKRELTMPEVYTANVGSVVSINVKTAMTNAFGQVVESPASGSGFLITKDGYIVTNYHVVEDASDVKVTLHSGEEYTATIVGGDEDYDVAVIKIDGGEWTPVVIGDSSALQIGETIAAIGNPLGELTFSMSQGIVSCVDRAINVDGTPFNMIQVDCSINPGNSGGPLVNSYGEVVGIVSAKYSSYSNTTVEGIGFAIPINDVIAMIEDVMTNGYVTNKPYLGITAGTLTASMAQQYRYTIDKGVFVYSVEEGGAAEKAGLKMGDVITGINDITIDSLEDLTAAKKKFSAGDTANFTIYREGKTQEVSFTFGSAPAKEIGAEKQPEQQQPSGGSGGYYYSDPWDYFNRFFGFGGNYGFGGNGTSSRDAA